VSQPNPFIRSETGEFTQIPAWLEQNPHPTFIRSGVQAIGPADIGNAVIVGAMIALSTISAQNIADATITSQQIAPATIQSSNIAAGTITGGNIASGTILAGNIANLTITAGQIANLTITAGQIAAATITGAKVASATITNSNIAIFESSEQTITDGGALTIAHGLGFTPKFCQLVLVCKTAEQGYSIGDKLLQPVFGSVLSVSRGLAVTLDATNINVRYANSGASNTFAVVNFTSGSVVSLTNVDWKAVFRVW